LADLESLVTDLRTRDWHNNNYCRSPIANYQLPNQLLCIELVSLGQVLLDWCQLNVKGSTSLLSEPTVFPNPPSQRRALTGTAPTFGGDKILIKIPLPPLGGG